MFCWFWEERNPWESPEFEVVSRKRTTGRTTGGEWPSEGVKLTVHHLYNFVPNAFTTGVLVKFHIIFGGMRLRNLHAWRVSNERSPRARTKFARWRIPRTWPACRTTHTQKRKTPLYTFLDNDGAAVIRSTASTPNRVRKSRTWNREGPEAFPTAAAQQHSSTLTSLTKPVLGSTRLRPIAAASNERAATADRSIESNANEKSSISTACARVNLQLSLGSKVIANPSESTYHRQLTFRCLSREQQQK
jgi:hypothetical protein